MLDVTDRSMRRIRLDYPDHTKDVLDWLAGLADLVTRSRQNPERMYAAVVRYAAGRLDRFGTPHCSPVRTGAIYSSALIWPTRTGLIAWINGWT